MSSQVCQSVIQGKADIGFCFKILPDPQLVYAAIQRGPWWPPSLWTTLWPVRTP